MIDSADPIALGDSVQGIEASITGDFTSCTDLAQILVTLPGEANPNLRPAYFLAKPGANLSNKPAFNLGEVNGVPAVLTQAGLTPSHPGLSVIATCTDKLLGTIATPSFTVSYTFTWIHTPPVVSFN